MNESKRAPVRAAFTLVELLVVIAIIGVLVALLLPAVQAAREAANRMSCTNNLKQLGIAVHNYHDTVKVMPFAANSPSNDAQDDAWGWCAMLLPFMEQQGLYDQIGCGNGAKIVAPTSTNGLQTYINGLACPSAPREKFAKYWGNYGHSNYVISEGIASNETSYNAIGLADVIDGTSNTFLASERSTYRQLGATWVGKNGLSLASQTFRTLDPPNTPTVNAAGVPADTPPCKRFGIKSEHPAGVCVVLCDGSVHFLSETVQTIAGNDCGDTLGTSLVHKWTPNNNLVYQNLFNRQDGNPVTIP